jgi:V/A-type H+-transporting ATPase subunit G/H
MARDEILSKIKQAEADAKAAVQQAVAEKDKKIAAATTEAGNIVRAAETEAQEYYDKSLSKAADEVKSKKQSIMQSGMRSVDSMSSSASGKMDKAVEQLLKEFMRVLHA